MKLDVFRSDVDALGGIVEASRKTGLRRSVIAAYYSQERQPRWISLAKLSLLMGGRPDRYE